MIRPTALLLLITILTCCTDKKKTSPTLSNDPLKEIAKQSQALPDDSGSAFQLDYFTTLPDKIDGCGEYYTYDTSAFGKENYIFLSNLTEYAIIKVKGKEIYLTKDTSLNNTINNKNYSAVYKGQGYKAILKMQQTKAYDEGGFYRGTLEIEGNAIKVHYKIHGEAGC